jgi:O-methyltransferase
MNYIIYGCGLSGSEQLNEIRTRSGDSVVAFCDSNSEYWGKEKDGVSIISPDALPYTIFDEIIISPINKDHAVDIYIKLIDLKIKREKISFCSVFNHEHDREILMNRLNEVILSDLPGAFAECGVYRGDFSVVLNRLFPERKLYLFDTFEGYSKKDMETEKALGNEWVFSREYFKISTDFFKETSVELVKSRMINPENVIFKKGWIPDSFDGVDDKFAFVRLDLNLYDPMLASFRFFYPKMEHGGVLLIHDYGYKGRYTPEPCPGVKKALYDFEKETGQLVKVPLPFSSDLIIIKT